MSRIQNIVLVVLAVAFLCGPISLAAAEKLKVGFPAWFTAAEAKWMSGGYTDADVRGNMTLEGISTERFQQAVEDELGNHIPIKARSMVASATLQRGAIAASNALFNWECYPTYFGSDVVYIPSNDAVLHTSQAWTQRQRDSYASFAAGVREAALRHPDKRFIVFLAPAFIPSAHNPSDAYVTGAFTSEDAERVMREGLEGIDNVVFLTDNYGSRDEFFEYFYRTDHHWNIDGALRAYGVFADALQLEPIDVGDRIEFPGYTFMGATARKGLIDFGEEVYDYDIDYSELEMAGTQDGPVPYSHEYYGRIGEMVRHYTFYTSYYDFAVPGWAFVDEGKQGSALLVSESYGGAVRQLLAMNYGRMDLSLHLHNNLSISKLTRETRFESLLQGGDYDDVIFLASANDYLYFMERCPRYFDA